MLRILVWIDQWILGEFERLSHGIQKLTGKNCFWLARAVLMPLWVIGARSFEIFVLVSIFGSCLFVTAKLYERVADAAVSRGLRNPIGYPNPEAAVIRLFQFGVALYNLFVYLPEFWVVIVPVYYYLISCTPLPPCKSKIREWIEALNANPILSTGKV